MKINSLLESQTPSSAISNTTTSAPVFGRDEDKLEETTTSGSVATVASPVGKVRSRGSIFSGIKTSEKFPNSKQVKEENLPVSDKKQKYIQAAKDVLKGADFDHVSRIRNLDVEMLRKFVGFAHEKLSKGEYKLNRPNLEEYGDTKKGQKMLTKVQKRAVDRVTSKQADTDPKYAKKNSDTANRAWDRMSDKDLTEGSDVDVNVVIGKLYDAIDHADDVIKNADFDRQIRIATVSKDHAIQALNMIKQGGNTPEAADAAFKFWYTGKKGVAETPESTPFGNVVDQRPPMSTTSQQDRESQDQQRERQARISDFREKKQDLLQQFAQLGTLRTEMIYGLENNVFLTKEQLIDFFKQQIDDPSLTALEYAHDNGIGTDGLIKHILRRATQLGISMLDVRKMFNQAKQKVSENSVNRKTDAKGLTQSEWIQSVKQKFPDAKIIQAKMIDGPAHALLSDGRKIVWNPVQNVAEAGANFRAGNARRAAINAMTPEERKAYDQKRAEQQRKRDQARMERERQRNAAKKGVAEGPAEVAGLASFAMGGGIPGGQSPAGIVDARGVIEEYEDEDCHVCSGTGEGRTEYDTCYHCKGTGVEPHEHDDDDFDIPDDDFDDFGDDESYYEKSLRRRNLDEVGPRAVDDQGNPITKPKSHTSTEPVEPRKFKTGDSYSTSKGVVTKTDTGIEHKPRSSITPKPRFVEEEQMEENLHKWFKEKWVRFGPDGKIRGDCARGDDSEGKPKCLPQSKAHSLGKKGRASAAARKRREDPNPERSGKAINVNTKKKSNESVAVNTSGVQSQLNTKDPNFNSLLYKLRNNYPVPRGRLLNKVMMNGRWLDPDEIRELVEKGQLWKNLGYGQEGYNARGMGPGEEMYEGVAEAELDEACWKGYHKEGNKKMFGKTYPNCVKNTNEEQLDEKCWDTHKQVGMKNKGGKQVLNCVPKEDVAEEKCPHCGGAMFSEMIMNEKKDACYYKVKSRYKVWPSAYASGALVKCRNKGAKNWGTGGKKNESMNEAEISEEMLANELYKDLQIFKQTKDKTIGKKSKSKDISKKPKDRDIVVK